MVCNKCGCEFESAFCPGCGAAREEKDKQQAKAKQKKTLRVAGKKSLRVIVGIVIFIALFCVIFVVTFMTRLIGIPSPSVNGDVRNEEAIQIHEYAGQIEPLMSSYKQIKKDAILCFENISDYDSMLISLRIFQTEIIPESKNLVIEAATLVPKTQITEEINDLFLLAVNGQDEALSEIVAALEKKEYEKLEAAGEKLLIAYDFYNDVNSMFLDIISTYLNDPSIFLK